MKVASAGMERRLGVGRRARRKSGHSLGALAMVAINKWTLVSIMVAVVVICLRIHYHDTFTASHAIATIVQPEPEEAERYIQNAAGLWLYTQHWEPSTLVDQHPGVIFIFHGYGEHSGRAGYQWLATELAERGWEVVAMDHQGHGRSSGTRGHVSQFQDLVDDAWLLIESYMEERDGPALIFAHSMGTLVSTLVALDHPDDIGGIVYSGMPIEIDPSLATPFFRSLGNFLSSWLPKIIVDELPADNLPESRNGDELIFTQYRARFSVEFMNACHHITRWRNKVKYPFRMYHGAYDNLAGVAGAQAFHDKAGSEDKHIEILPNGYHELLEGEYREQILDETDEFFASLVEDDATHARLEV